MNTYLVPVTKRYQSNFTDIMVVYANTEKEAYFTAQSEVGFAPITVRKYIDVPYDFYVGKLDFKERFFPISKKHDIIKQILSLSKEVTYLETIDIYDYMYWGDYNLQIQKLADKALPEKWSFEGKDDNYILKNYLKYTFNKLQEEGKVIETDTYCAFDTGLFLVTMSQYMHMVNYIRIHPKTLQNGILKVLKIYMSWVVLISKNFLKEQITFQIQQG